MDAVWRQAATWAAQSCPRSMKQLFTQHVAISRQLSAAVLSSLHRGSPSLLHQAAHQRHTALLSLSHCPPLAVSVIMSRSARSRSDVISISSNDEDDSLSLTQLGERVKRERAGHSGSQDMSQSQQTQPSISLTAPQRAGGRRQPSTAASYSVSAASSSLFLLLSTSPSLWSAGARREGGSRGRRTAGSRGAGREEGRGRGEG